MTDTRPDPGEPTPRLPENLRTERSCRCCCFAGGALPEDASGHRCAGWVAMSPHSRPAGGGDGELMDFLYKYLGDTYFNGHVYIDATAAQFGISSVDVVHLSLHELVRVGCHRHGGVQLQEFTNEPCLVHYVADNPMLA